VIGKGGFGKVYCVKYKKNNHIYAMKEMHKTKIIGKKSIHSVLNER
jgi:serine/threonine protein kinase